MMKSECSRAAAPNHMEIHWHECVKEGKDRTIADASLAEKASVIGRIGLMLLSCGTGAWRVRQAMNAVAQQLNLTCAANVGLMTIDYTCFDGAESFSQSLCIKSSGVNTNMLNRLERFVRDFPQKYLGCSAGQIHTVLDGFADEGGLYKPWQLGLASALACGGFTFLLGGGLPEIICAFLGAGAGNYLRSRLTKRGFTLLLCVVTSVALACLVYAGAIRALEALLHVSSQHEVGYICAMLFIIPGFPFITSGIDIAKQDMRSGMERLMYALLIIVTATLTAWVTALALHLAPADFQPYDMAEPVRILLRLIASVCGVFGFSLMFNSPVNIALSAAVIGAISNTFRLTLVDLTPLPSFVCAFLGALTAGLLASIIKSRLGFPRISITVPSIVIMVPGLYLYRSVYYLGVMDLTDSTHWLASAMLIILALPLGLVAARIITDRNFRICS